MNAYRFSLFSGVLGLGVFFPTCVFSQSPTPAKRGTPTANRNQPKEPTLAKRPDATAAPSATEKPDREKTKATLVTSAKSPPVDASSASERYKLRYNLKANTKVVSEVTHLAKTNTKINDESQSSQSRSVSKKVWTVNEVAANGDMTFIHHVDSVEMSKQIGDGEELRYNSATDKEPPTIFEKVAETIGKPLATITINKLAR